MTRQFNLAVTCAALTLAGAAMAQSSKDQTPQRDRTMPADSQRERLDLQKCSDVLDLRVNTNDNKRAGQIQNLGIDRANGRVVFVIVQTETDPNAGEGFKIVPFEALDFQGQAARLNVDANRFKDAPPFDPAGWGTSAGSGRDSKWERIVYQHYGITPRDAERGNERDDARVLDSARNLLKMNVRNDEQQQLGQINDLAIDTNRGMVVYAIMNTKFAGGEKSIAVPWNSVTVRSADNLIVLDLDRERLREAPTFTNFQSLGNRTTMADIFAFYGTEPDAVYGYVPPADRRRDRDDDDARSPRQVRDAGGWDHRSEYGRLFNAGEVDTVRGRIEGIERFTPMTGMSEGMRLRLRAENDRIVLVHLGPAWFIERQTLPFADGDQVAVTGSRATVDGQAAMMASEVRRGDAILYLRDRQGTPRWDASYRINELGRPGGGDR